MEHHPLSFFLAQYSTRAGLMVSLAALGVQEKKGEFGSK